MTAVDLGARLARRRCRRATGSAAARPARSSRWHEAQSLQVQARSPLRPLVRRQRAGPREIVRVDVIQPGLADRTPEPPHSAPPSKPGKTTVCCADARAARTARRSGTSRTARAPTACASGVRVVSISSVRRCRANGAGLRRESAACRRGDFAGHVARRKPAVLDREERLAVRAIEQEDVARAWSSARRRRSSGRSAGP